MDNFLHQLLHAIIAIHRVCIRSLLISLRQVWLILIRFFCCLISETQKCAYWYLVMQCLIFSLAKHKAEGQGSITRHIPKKKNNANERQVNLCDLLNMDGCDLFQRMIYAPSLPIDFGENVSAVHLTMREECWDAEKFWFCVSLERSHHPSALWF